MNNNLVAKSKPILLDLDNYEEGTSIINGYLIKDSYSIPKIKHEHGQYRLIIESPIISDESDLVNYMHSTKEIAQQLTILSKCVIGEALNISPWEFMSFTRKIETIGQMPPGWESNYDPIQKEFDKKKQFTACLVGEPIHYYMLPKSPFNDFITAFKAFPRLKRIEKDLLQILNDADLVSFTGRYMLLGKAIEMVDSMFPFTNGEDDRIQTILPELSEQFKGVTIKKLRGLANTRRETRHYVQQSNKSLSHPTMSVEERKLFYSMTNQLCLNILRRSLGLGLVNFSTD